MQMSHNSGQSSLKDLLQNYGKCHKSHSMTTRYEDQAFINDDTEETPAPQDTVAQYTTPTTPSILELDSETATGYSEETNPQNNLVQLQKHFQQLQERFNQLGPTTSVSIHVKEKDHLTEK